MKSTISVKRKMRGRPSTGVDPLVGVRMPESLIVEIDAWAKPRDLSRSGAIRELVEVALKSGSPKDD